MVLSDVLKSSSNVLIDGDMKFIEKTDAALSLIKEKSPEHYKLVKGYISIIRKGKKTGMWAQETPPFYEVAPMTSDGTLSWYASTIVHDAYHSKLFHDYLDEFGTFPPDDVWTGRKAENSCLEVQESFLRKIQAPAGEIQHVQRMKNVDYYTNYNQRDW